jgi:L-ascorbate metabolism protein UlaG (beta-lactamase superfamily)
MKVSDHFDGKRYHNPYASFTKKSIWDVLRWLSTRRLRPWPSQSFAPQKINQERLKTGQVGVTFINHSTILIQLGTYNILTDPIWSDRCSPFRWIGPKRFCLPGVKFEDLPPIDFVLVSHNHYDHMDLCTLRKLKQKFDPPLYVSAGNKRYLEKKGFQNVAEFDWWDSLSLSSDLQLTFVPAQHFANRGLFDRDKTLWGGFVLQHADHIVYFAADTGYGPFFQDIRQKIGAPTLALLPIGVYEPRWFMSPIHMSPQDAVQAHIDLQAKQSMGIHYGTFRLGDEPFEAPKKDLQEELQRRHLSLDEFWILKPGEGKIII